MKVVNILLGLLLVVMLTSCDKEQDLNIKMTNINSGKLIVTVVDGEGNPLAEVRVKVYSGYSSSPLFDEYTDENGKFDFGKVTSGNYQISLEDVEVNGIKYFPSKIIQVIAGEDKSVEINVEEYVGTMIFTMAVWKKLMRP